MDRRRFLTGTASVGAAYSLGAGFWRAALAEPATPGPGPYGPLAPPDANGIRLPAGFTSTVIAESGQVVGGTAHVWHLAPDGAATFPAAGGGWVYVSNSEIPLAGGVSALRFDAVGTVTAGYPILAGTSVNCAGGPTPWGTWLSCEEFDLGPPLAGMVWECDPGGPGDGEPRPALGRFSHEAVCVDPADHRLYLSEDQGDGRFYRFTPAAWRDDGSGVLDNGTLEAAAVAPDGAVTWLPVGDPSAALTSTRDQTAAATAFDGGEGLWFDSGTVYLATKGDRRLWAYDTTVQRIEVLYDATPIGPDDEQAIKVDNVVVSRGGELFVAEDSGDRNRIAVLTGVGAAAGGPVVSPFLEVIEAASGSEIAGPTFDPSGTRLFFSSQRGASIRDGGGEPLRGITYMVSGPFTGRVQAPVATTTTTATTATTATASTAPAAGGNDDGLLPATGASGLLAVGAAALAGAAIVRRQIKRCRP